MINISHLQERREESYSNENTKVRGVSGWFKISTSIFLFLLPFFIVPIAGWTVRSSKIVLLLIYGVMAFIFLALELWKSRSRSVGASYIGLGFLLVAVASGLSAFAYPNLIMGLEGKEFDIGASVMIVLLAFIATAIMRSINSTKDVVVYSLAVISGIIVTIGLQALKNILGAFVTLPLWLGGTTFNLISRWNDLGVISMIALFAVIFAFRILRRENLPRMWSYVIFGASLFIIFIVNLKIVQLLTAIVSIVLLIEYFLNRRRREEENNPPKSYAILLIVSAVVGGLLYIDANWGLLKNAPSNLTNKLFGISTLEVYPDAGTTLDIAVESWKVNPLIGTGPGSFKNMWRLHKPLEVNTTPFWTTDFNYGVGFIPTMAVTGGLLSLVAYVFLTLIVLRGSWVLYRYSKEVGGVSRYVLSSIAVFAAFLWVFLWIYTPGIALYTLIWISAGLLFGALKSQDLKGSIFSIQSSILSFVLLLLFIITSGALGYSAFRQFAALYYFERGSYSAATSPDIQNLLVTVNKALTWHPQDLYARSVAEVLFTKFAQDISNPETNKDTESLQALLDGTLSYAQGAVMLDQQNAENYIFLGELYRALHAQKVAGSYESALSAYEKALELAPSNPGLYVLRARLHFEEGKRALAMDDLEKAISLKSNYTEAVFLLSQLLIDEGSEDEALAALEERAKIAPPEPLVFFQIGFIKYSTDDLEGAKEALENAVITGGDYANAMYFLGLTYDRLGLKAEALALFKRIKELNPEVKELDTIISNLEAGKRALPSSLPPSESPENRDKLPVEEDSAEPVEE